MKRWKKITASLLALVGLVFLSLALVISYDSACTPAPELSEQSERMKAIYYSCYGSTDVLEVAQVEKPKPADDQILIKIRAAGVNPLDWHYMRGSPYLMRLGSGLGLPDNPGLGVDFAGTVEAVGEKVTKFKPGDEVFGGGKGAFAEYLTIAENGAVSLIPANMSFEQAASVPIAAITALQALRDEGQVQKGQRVLINGASGGVGTFAVQIAKYYGAEVTGVCSARNHEMVRSMGADHVIDYRQVDYTRTGHRYDLIIDMVGNHSLSENRQALEADGSLVMVGGAKGNWIGPLKNPLKALLYSPFVGQKFITLLASLRQTDLDVLGDLMSTGKLTPVMDRSYPLNEVPDALRYSEEGHARGKIVISME